MNWSDQSLRALYTMLHNATTDIKAYLESIDMDDTLFDLLKQDDSPLRDFESEFLRYIYKYRS